MQIAKLVNKSLFMSLLNNFNQKNILWVKFTSTFFLVELMVPRWIPFINMKSSDRLKLFDKDMDRHKKDKAP